METCMHYWITVVPEEEEIPERFRRLIQCLKAYFYVNISNDGLIASMRAVRLQHSFDVLMDLFGCVGLRENV